MSTPIYGPGNQPLRTFKDWESCFTSRGRDGQWKEGYSAHALAEAWFGKSGSPSIPRELQALFDSDARTRELKVASAHVEARVPFDGLRGEPRNTDLLLRCESPMSAVISIEAKAGESFGRTVRGAREAARIAKEGNPLSRSKNEKARFGNPNSRAMQRLDELLASVLGIRPGDSSADDLRYQLLTATAGAVAAAKGAAFAGLVIHSLIGHPKNKRPESFFAKSNTDLEAFLRRLSGNDSLVIRPCQWVGPLRLPGFAGSTWPDLFVGRIETRLNP